MDPEESARNSDAYKKASEDADDIAKDIKKLTKLLEDANRKAERKKEGPLKSFIETFKAARRMVVAWHEGRLAEVPWKSVSMIVTAALYLVLPFDAMFDFLPGIGLLDDMAIIGWTLRTVKRDIDRFRDWEEREREAAAAV